MADKSLIKALVESWGPPGYEHLIRSVIREQVNDLADEIRVDPGGSLVCRMGSGGPKIMIAAHMDEIGLIVHHIDRDGYARFSLIGGLFPLTLWGGRVKFADGTLGTIGLDGAYQLTELPKINDFYLDISTGLDRFSTVKIGHVATPWRDYAEQGDRIIAKSLDDRIGCAVAIEAMRLLAGQKLPAELYFVFTTQEEVGIRGARTAAYGVNPDFGIALDVTPSGDQPGQEKLAVRLGAGACIKVRDTGHIVPPSIKELMIRRAEEAKIPYQLEVLDMGTTDASAMQSTALGIPSGAISIACRMVHTTSEMVDVNDVDASIRLLVAVLSHEWDMPT